MRRSAGYVIAGVLLTGLLVSVIFVMRQLKSTSASLSHNAQRSQGPADAPVQIIEYSDFQCPACGKAQPALNQLLREFEGKIRLTYQHYPLHSHAWSEWAHQAAECAARQDHFWAFHDRLYTEQALWAEGKQAPLEIFLRYAKEGGLDLDTFGRCLTDRSVSSKIREERVGGEGLGIRSTPSFFVNGELIVGVAKLREKVTKILKL